MPLTRRACLRAAAVPLGCVPLAARGDTPTATLREAASRIGVRFGANSEVAFGAAPAAYRDLFVSQCALFAPTVWAPAVSPRPGEYDFDPDGEGISFAAANGLKLTGGHLYWYYHSPDWYASVTGQPGAEAAITDYARAVAQRYRGLAYAWNAVNEAIDPRDGHPLGLRRCWAMSRIGPDYVDLAFRAGRRGDPDALLVINDSDMELDTPEQERRRAAMLRVLDDLLRRGTPVGGVGLQSHLKLASFRSFNPAKYRAFLAEIAARNLKILITELDVLDVGAPGAMPARDRLVADAYRRFLDPVVDEGAVAAIVTWGLSDRYTWLNPGIDARFGRLDGLASRPLPFDSDFDPKPAFDAIMTAFRTGRRR